jgi:hypothetical protein
MAFYRGRGRPMGFNRNNDQQEEPLDPASWPGRTRILEAMKTVARQQIYNGKPEPKEDTKPPLEPPPGERLYKHMRDIGDNYLLQSDFNERGSRGQLTRLFRAANVGLFRVYRRETPWHLADRTEVTLISEDDPSNEEAHDAEPWVVGHQKRPVLITGWSTEIYDAVEGTSQHGGSLIARSIVHQTERCCCLAQVEQNNTTFATFCMVCMPRTAMKPLKSRKYKLPEIAAFSGKDSQLNPSMIYAAKLTKSGTVSTKLMCRQPLAAIARKKLVPWRPAFCNTRWDREEDKLNGLIIQAHKKDFRGFIELIDAETGIEPAAGVYGDWARFPSTQQQVQSDDIDRRGNANMYLDLELSNTVHIAPAWGPHECPYCDETVYGKGFTTLLEHLASKHEKLATSYFSCPTCMTVEILDWQSYPAHYAEKHQVQEAMCVVFDISCVHSRTSWGIALVMWITALDTSGVDRTNLPAAGETKQYRSAYGGYAPDDKEEYAKQLADDIMRRRLQAVPDADLDRRHEVSRKKELANIAKKKKAAPVPRAVTPDVVVEDQTWTEVCMRKHMKTTAKRAEGSTEPFSMETEDPDDKPGPSGAKRPKEEADPEKGYFTRAAAAAAMELEVEDEFADPDQEPGQTVIPSTEELLESDDENNNA